MSSGAASSDSPVVDEPLRLVLSQQERDYIDKRIGRAKRQLAWSISLPTGYFAALALWVVLQGLAGLSGDLVNIFFILGFFVLFGSSFYLLLAGTVDWIVFARYRRNHRAFLHRYNRT